jgi:hypothetical protein
VGEGERRERGEEVGNEKEKERERNVSSRSNKSHARVIKRSKRKCVTVRGAKEVRRAEPRLIGFFHILIAHFFHSLRSTYLLTRLATLPAHTSPFL